MFNKTSNHFCKYVNIPFGTCIYKSIDIIFGTDQSIPIIELACKAVYKYTVAHIGISSYFLYYVSVIVHYSSYIGSFGRPLLASLWPLFTVPLKFISWMMDSLRNCLLRPEFSK